MKASLYGVVAIFCNRASTTKKSFPTSLGSSWAAFGCPKLQTQQGLGISLAYTPTAWSHTMTSPNRAAWMTAPRNRPLQVGSAPIGTPEAGQILIKNHAVAINPIDVMLQQIAMYPLEYPAIIGQDVAGEVEAVGPDMTRFKKAQRVLANTSFPSKRNEDKAFQLYTIVQADLACEIPPGMSMERAAVVPTGLTTAACALFQPDCLGLRLPPPTTPPDTKAATTTTTTTERGAEEEEAVSSKSVLLVWGGASSVGCSAIQLAAAAGYRVLTTASPRNFDLVRGLGADLVVDYGKPSAVPELVRAAEGHGVVVGALDASGRAAARCVEFVEACGGVKFVAATTGGNPPPPPGVTVKHIYGPSIVHSYVAKAIYGDFLPNALRDGRYVPAPEPLVAGKGLESIQEALDLHSKGVSAQKVVVSLNVE
jgi:NADPH:quinone reductase-like Zn-dependent oxidoreductase